MHTFGAITDLKAPSDIKKNIAIITAKNLVENHIYWIPIVSITTNQSRKPIFSSQIDSYNSNFQNSENYSLKISSNICFTPQLYQIPSSGKNTFNFKKLNLIIICDRKISIFNYLPRIPCTIITR